MAAASKQVVWSLEADRDLLDIWSFLASAASPEVADDQIRKIVRACEPLSDQPLLGRMRDELVPGLRSKIAYPHVIFYRVTTAAVEIVRVFDGRRDLDDIFEDDVGDRGRTG